MITFTVYLLPHHLFVNWFLWEKIALLDLFFLLLQLFGKYILLPPSLPFSVSYYYFFFCQLYCIGNQNHNRILFLLFGKLVMVIGLYNPCVSLFSLLFFFLFFSKMFTGKKISSLEFCLTCMLQCHLVFVRSLLHHTAPLENWLHFAIEFVKVSGIVVLFLT